MGFGGRIGLLDAERQRAARRTHPFNYYAGTALALPLHLAPPSLAARLGLRGLALGTRTGNISVGEFQMHPDFPEAIRRTQDEAPPTTVAEPRLENNRPPNADAIENLSVEMLEGYIRRAAELDPQFARELEGMGVIPPAPQPRLPGPVLEGELFPPVPLMERPQPSPQARTQRLYYGGAAELPPTPDLRTLLPGFSAGQDLARGVAERDPAALGIGAAGLLPWGRPNMEWLRRLLGRERALPAPNPPSVPNAPPPRTLQDIQTPAGSVEARMRIMDWMPPGRVPPGRAPEASYFEQMDALRWYLQNRRVPDEMPWAGDPDRLRQFLLEAVQAYRTAGPNAYGRRATDPLAWHQGGGAHLEPTPPPAPPPAPPTLQWRRPQATDMTITWDRTGRPHRASGQWARQEEATEFRRLLEEYLSRSRR
jgi:hypothetical protein